MVRHIRYPEDIRSDSNVDELDFDALERRNDFHRWRNPGNGFAYSNDKEFMKKLWAAYEAYEIEKRRKIVAEMEAQKAALIAEQKAAQETREREEKERIEEIERKNAIFRRRLREEKEAEDEAEHQKKLQAIRAQAVTEPETTPPPTQAGITLPDEV